MNRILIMIATVGFILAVGCFAAAGLAGAGSWNQAWRWGPGWTLGGDDGPWTGGPVITRQYRWDGGDSLRIDAPADLDYTQGPLISLAITGPKALLEGELLLLKAELAERSLEFRRLATPAATPAGREMCSEDLGLAAAP